MLNKSHSLIHSADIRQLVVKIKKMYDTFWPRWYGLCPYQLTKDTSLWQTFFSKLYLFGSICSIIVWTNECHDFGYGICFPDKSCYENGQKTFLQWW